MRPMKSMRANITIKAPHPLLGLLLIFFMMGHLAHATKEKVSQCRFTTNDVGTIIGQGPQKYDAYKDAVEQCVQLYSQQYQKTHAQEIDETRYSLLIDTCTQKSCSFPKM